MNCLLLIKIGPKKDDTHDLGLLLKSKILSRQKILKNWQGVSAWAWEKQHGALVYCLYLSSKTKLS